MLYFIEDRHLGQLLYERFQAIFSSVTYVHVKVAWEILSFKM